jgi:hypothetical protein
LWGDKHKNKAEIFITISTKDSEYFIIANRNERIKCHRRAKLANQAKSEVQALNFCFSVWRRYKRGKQKTDISDINP